MANKKTGDGQYLTLGHYWGEMATSSPSYFYAAT
jgi:hypothetical protein